MIYQNLLKKRTPTKMGALIIVMLSAFIVNRNRSDGKTNCEVGKRVSLVMLSREVQRLDTT